MNCGSSMYWVRHYFYHQQYEPWPWPMLIYLHAYHSPKRTYTYPHQATKTLAHIEFLTRITSHLSAAQRHPQPEPDPSFTAGPDVGRQGDPSRQLFQSTPQSLGGHHTSPKKALRYQKRQQLSSPASVGGPVGEGI